jgi:type IV secretion system protein VirB1
MAGLSFSAALALAAQCAPGVAAETLLSVAHAESNLDPFAIGVNDGPPVRQPRTAAEAAALARMLLARGYSIDLGISQINSRNLGWLGLSVEAAFDPCRNLAAAARVLRANYSAASRRYAGAGALGAALSMYNTGHPERGYRNGYVARVYRAAAIVVPAVRAGTQPAPPVAAPSPAIDPSIPRGSPLDANLAASAAAPGPDSVAVSDGAGTSIPVSAAPAWDVFGTAGRASVHVFGGMK